MIASVELVRELTTLEPDAPVHSVHVRTDSRDPASTAVTPKWLVEAASPLASPQFSTSVINAGQALPARQLDGRTC